MNVVRSIKTRKASFKVLKEDRNSIYEVFTDVPGRHRPDSNNVYN